MSTSSISHLGTEDITTPPFMGESVLSFSSGRFIGTRRQAVLAHWQCLIEKVDSIFNEGLELRKTRQAVLQFVERPKHGSIKPYLKEWKDRFSQKCTFEDYLRREKAFTFPERIHFLSEEERRLCQPSIVCIPDFAGKQRCRLLDINGEPLKNGQHLFILSMEQKLYVAEEREWEKEGIVWHIKHSSISWGKAVLTAGEFTITDGFLCKIISKSGHYCPSKRDESKILFYLRLHGVDINTIQIEPIPRKKDPI